MGEEDSGAGLRRGWCGVGTFVAAGRCVVCSDGKHVRLLEAQSDEARARTLPRVAIQPAGGCVVQLCSPTPNILVVVQLSTSKKAVLVRKYRCTKSELLPLGSYETPCSIAPASPDPDIQSIGCGYAILEDKQTLLGPDRVRFLGDGLSRALLVATELAHFSTTSVAPHAPLILCTTSTDKWALINATARDGTSACPSIPHEYASTTTATATAHAAQARLCLVANHTKVIVLSPRSIVNVVDLSSAPSSILTSASTFMLRHTSTGPLTCISAINGALLQSKSTSTEDERRNASPVLCAGHTTALTPALCVAQEDEDTFELVATTEALPCTRSSEADTGVVARLGEEAHVFHSALVRKLAADQTRLARVRALNRRKERLVTSALSPLCLAPHSNKHEPQAGEREQPAMQGGVQRQRPFLRVSRGKQQSRQRGRQQQRAVKEQMQEEMMERIKGGDEDSRVTRLAIGVGEGQKVGELVRTEQGAWVCKGGASKSHVGSGTGPSPREHGYAATAQLAQRLVCEAKREQGNEMTTLWLQRLAQAVQTQADNK